MYLTYRTVPDGITIRIHGEMSRLDMPAIKRAIADFKCLSRIGIDLSELSFLESSFAGALFELREADPEFARRIELIRPNGTVAETMRIMKLDEAYAVAPPGNGKSPAYTVKNGAKR